MNLSAVQKILGILLMLFSLTMLPPAGVAFYYADGTFEAFLDACMLLMAIGGLIWLPVWKRQDELKVSDGFLVVVLFWSVLGLAGALPFIIAHNPQLAVSDAIFESISGLSTTGATTIIGLDYLPPAILYYRQQLQWLGGMGIIVLAVAVLPMLGIGGMQLYRAEIPGPIKDSKLTPRIAETAKALWYIYFGLTLACALAYWMAGMSVFDAIGHSFATVAIGGFSTHDASIGFFNSDAIELIAVVFMLISGVNFALHFLAWHQRSLTGYLLDSEFRFYLLVMGLTTTLVFLGLLLTGTYPDWSESFTQALFHTVSIASTTGFSTSAFYDWPIFLGILLIFSSFVGGCAGSTGGGIKVIRFLLLIKQGFREIERLIHPNAQIPVRVNGRSVNHRVVDAVWGFFALYVACFTFMYLALAATGMDLTTAFSAVAACMNNLGPGLGEVGSSFATVGPIAKGILCFAMLLGRLEVFTLLVLLSPTFWRG